LFSAEADTDDDGHGDVDDIDGAAGIAGFVDGVLRHRRRDEFATPATIAAATITGIVFDADDESNDGRRVLIVHLRAQQNTSLRERIPVPAGFAQAIIGE